MSFLKKIINKIFYRPITHFHGENNKLVAGNSARFKKTKITIWGNNNKIFIGENVYLHKTNIIIGFPNCRANNCTIKIDRDTSVNSMLIQMGEDNSSVDIGEDCMFSFNIEINCTDHHAIFDENNNIINLGKSIKIGNHVWVCKNVTIQKNSTIADGCVIGQNAVVAKKFEEPNCVIVGNPAKVVKQKIKWDRSRPNNPVSS